MKGAPKLVTKDWIRDKVAISPEVVIGRALLAIFNNQEPEEQDAEATTLLNNIGFTAFDAELGTKCAKYFQEHKALEHWMVNVWRKPDTTGYPRIARYHRQLNDIAVSKLIPKLSV